MEIIRKGELDKLIDFKKVFSRTQSAFKLFSEGKTITPPFTVFTIPQSNGSVHFKCGYVPGDKYFAMKYSGAFYGNDKLGLSNFLGLFMVFNAITGEVEAIIDDKGYLTDYRTGIAGAVATTALARKNSKNVGIIGTGVQARMQLSALLNVKNIDNVYVWGRNPNSVKKYIDQMQAVHKNMKFYACDSAKQVCENSDIIYTVTYSDKPLISADWVKPGTHITAVGACEPNMQELDSKLLGVADIVCVDSIDACLKNGELHHAVEEGYLDKNSEKVLELGTFMSSNRTRTETDITICDLVGLGFQDAVIASCVMNSYKEILNRNFKSKS